MDFLFFDVRVNLYVFEPERVAGTDLDFSDNAVPVGLRPLVQGVGLADWRNLRIIDQYGQGVFTGCH